MVKTLDEWDKIKLHFKPLVDSICAEVAKRINTEAPFIDVDCTYKSQMALELVIEELQKSV